MCFREQEVKNTVKSIVGIIVGFNSLVFALSYDAGSFRQGTSHSLYLTSGRPNQLTAIQVRQIMLQPSVPSLSLINFSDTRVSYTYSAISGTSLLQYDFGYQATLSVIDSSYIGEWPILMATPSSGFVMYVIPEPATVLLLTLGGLLLRKKC
jgi:hypothetical protein